MNGDFRLRQRIDVVLLAALALGWSVFAYGAVAHHYRSTAVVLTALAAGWALVRLPGPGWFPRVPRVVAAAVVVLLAFGWFMVLNAVADHSFYTWEFTGVENRIAPWAPGSATRTASLRAVLEASAVMLAMLAAVRTAQSSAWRALVGFLAILGALVALTGATHKALGAEAIWFVDVRQPPTFFAPFVYNANAGQFMNLTLPVAVGLWLSTAFDDERRAVSIFWAVVSVVIAVGVLLTASKGAIGILGLSLLLVVGLNRRRLVAVVRGNLRGRGRRFEGVLLVAGLAVLALLLLVFGVGLVISRWEAFIASFGTEAGPKTMTSRIKIIEILWYMSSPAEGSWHGFGPGSFRHLLPYFTVDETRQIEGRWDHAHCDPLQTVVEWGYLGAAAWWTIGAGAVVVAFLAIRRQKLAVDEVPVARGMAIGLALTGLHSWIDFPFSIYGIHLAAVVICGVCWGLWARGPAGGREKRVPGDGPAGS